VADSAGHHHRGVRQASRTPAPAQAQTPPLGSGPPASLQDRLELMKTVLASPPSVHPKAPGGVWRTSDDCYEFMAAHVREGSRTLETGAGISTVLLAAWGCQHLCVVPRRKEAEAIVDYCTALGLPTSSLSFAVRPSEEALPGLDGSDERDLLLIDGSHGFPLPIIDWFYGAAHLCRGGIVIFDDAQLPQLGPMLKFLDLDPRWEPVGSTIKWRAYRRLSSGPLAEDHYQQLFFTRAGLASWGSGLSPARRLLRRIGPKRA